MIFKKSVDQRAFGIDISKYQSSPDGSVRMNFDKVANYKTPISFIAARAGVSWGYRDPMFDFYWSEMARIKVCRMAYFVVYFGESATSQMDALFRIMEGKTNWRHDRLALDLEVAGINPPERITATTAKCLEIIKYRTGRYPIVYSRASWVNENMRVMDLPKLDWWLATYRRALPDPFLTPEHAGPPLLPRGVDTWLIHQTSDRGPRIGSVSYHTDHNRWNGDTQDVLRYFGNPSGMYVPEPVKEQFKAKCIVPALYKRNGPSPNYQAIGQLNLGDVVKVYEVKNNWFRLDPVENVWCSGYPQYMQPLQPVKGQPSALYRVRLRVPALYKRSGPGKDYPVTGNLVRGQVLSVFEESGGWVRVSEYDQIWCNAGSQYLERV